VNLTQKAEKEEPALLLERVEGEAEEEEPVLLMAQACALASGAEEVHMAPLQLEEPSARVLLGAEGEQKVEAGRWYLDTGASNHMTRSRAGFAELNSTVTGMVRFGDNSIITIFGQGGSHCALTGCTSSQGYGAASSAWDSWMSASTKG